jgi:hypothetical protein
MIGRQQEQAHNSSIVNGCWKLVLWIGVGHNLKCITVVLRTQNSIWSLLSFLSITMLSCVKFLKPSRQLKRLAEDTKLRSRVALYPGQNR